MKLEIDQLNTRITFELLGNLEAYFASCRVPVEVLEAGQLREAKLKFTFLHRIMRESLK